MPPATLPSRCSRSSPRSCCSGLQGHFLRTSSVPVRFSDLPLALSKGRRAFVLAWELCPLRYTVFPILRSTLDPTSSYTIILSHLQLCSTCRKVTDRCMF